MDILASRVIVEIVPRHKAPARPIGAEEIALVEVDDIVFEREGEVLFRPCARQLVFAVKREEIVAQDVLAAIVLMKSRALAVVNDVIFSQNIARPFV